MFLFLLIIIVTLFAQIFFPWWAIVPIVLLCCFLKAKTQVSAFTISFVGIFILWAVISLFLSYHNNHILASRVAEMFGFGKSSYNWFLLTIIAPLPVALIAGFSGISGFLLRKIISNI